MSSIREAGIDDAGNEQARTTMTARRYALGNDQWERIKDLLLELSGYVGVTAKDNRLFVEALLYRYRARIPWRYLPARSGDFRVEHTRYAYPSGTLRLTARYANSRWSKAGLWERVFQHLAEDANNKYAMIDLTIVRATSRVQGQRGGYISLSNWSQPKRIKHQNSCSGGCVTPGQTSNLDGADKLLPELAAYTVLADKAYDADERVIEPLQAQGKTGVIPPRRNCKNLRDYNLELYKARHLIELRISLPNSSGIVKLPHATRSEPRTFYVQLYFAAVIWLN